MVASFDSQYWHLGESDEIAAPQLGQLRVCACMTVRGQRGGSPSGAAPLRRHIARSDFNIQSQLLSIEKCWTN